MDSAQSNTSGGERRPSAAAASVRSIGNNDTTSMTGQDDYTLDDIPVADGFRPSNPAPEPESSTSQSESSPESAPPLLLSPLARTAPNPAPLLSLPQSNTDDENTSRGTEVPDVTNKGNPGPSIPRSSSTSKLHRPHESFTLRNDGSSNTAAANSFNPHSTTDSPLLRNDSPFHGSSSSSSQFLTDSSRTGPSTEGEYNGPRGPTHPYALYPQNTAMSEELSSQHIPIGFPGHTVTYQRQVGPDGEEIGDLVGPLGHMEELPPYTRYPDGPYATRSQFGTPASTNAGTTGADGSASPSVPASVSAAPNTSVDPSVDFGTNPSADASAAASAAASVDPSVNASVDEPGSPRHSSAPSAAWQTEPGDIALTNRTPEYSETDRSRGAVDGSNQSIQTGDSGTTGNSFNVAAKDFAERIDTGGKWHRRARKKLWGVVPYWAICLMIIGLLIVGIILGAVVGTVMANNGGGRGNPEA